MNATSTPYANLDPNVILDAVEKFGFSCTGVLFPLNSYENRVYQVAIEDAPPLIAKFYRPFRWSNEAIIEEHQFACELASYEIPVVAPLLLEDKTLHVHQDFRFALFPRQAGRPLDLDNPDQLEWMGRFLGRIHAVGACKPFSHRRCLDVTSYGVEPYQFLIDNNFIPLELKQQYCSTLETALKKIKERFLQAGEINVLRLHGDFHAGNILWNNEGPQIVDLDDCLMGPAIQDIWMLISGNTKAEIESQLNCILRGYREFYDFNPREIQLIEGLRTLRMIHYSAWLAKRWEDPAFPLNFPWFNTVSYWQEQFKNLHEQIYLLDKE